MHSTALQFHSLPRLYAVALISGISFLTSLCLWRTTFLTSSHRRRLRDPKVRALFEGSFCDTHCSRNLCCHCWMLITALCARWCHYAHGADDKTEAGGIRGFPEPLNWVTVYMDLLLEEMSEWVTHWDGKQLCSVWSPAQKVGLVLPYYWPLPYLVLDLVIKHFDFNLVLQISFCSDSSHYHWLIANHVSAGTQNENITCYQCMSTTQSIIK